MKTEHKSSPSADWILVNGNILTVDKTFTVTQAIAIRNSKIIAAGKNEDIKYFSGKSTRIIDLQSKTVLPGINDTHIHGVTYAGTRPPQTLIVGYRQVKSIADILKMVAKRVKELNPGEWIHGIGWNEKRLEECQNDPGRHPTRWDLDEVSPQNPVYLGDYSGHEVWVNSKALQLAEVTNETISPIGGEVVKHSLTGEPTGILREFAAQGLIMKVVPPWSQEQKREAILSLMKELNALGITSITEGGLGPGGEGYQGGLMDAGCISAYNDLHNAGVLTLRVNFLYLLGKYGFSSYGDYENILPKIGVHSGFGDEWLKIGGLKIFADGIPTNNTAWMKENMDGSSKKEVEIEVDRQRKEELYKIIQLGHNYGFQIGAHAIGDLAIETCIEGFIRAEKREPRKLRHYIIHGDFIPEKMAGQMSRDGINLCSQPSSKTTFSDLMSELVGIEKEAGLLPLKSLIEAGMHVSGSSDAPVHYPNWKQGIQSAVLREAKAIGKVSGPEQCLSREQAIRMYTIEGAWLDQMDHVKGSLEPGKLADLCVIDQDILSVEAHGIKDIQTLMTMVGGKVVYNAGII